MCFIGIHLFASAKVCDAVHIKTSLIWSLERHLLEKTFYGIPIIIIIIIIIIILRNLSDHRNC